MVRKTLTPEQIINKLREAEVLLSLGAIIGEASRKIGVTGQAYYRWRKEYGSLRLEQVVFAMSRQNLGMCDSGRLWFCLIHHVVGIRFSQAVSANRSCPR